MQGANRVKRFATRQVLKGAVRILPRISDQTWLSLVRGQLPAKGGSEGRLFLEKILLQFKRAMNVLSPRCREKFIMNFVGNAVMFSRNKKKTFEDKEGFQPPSLLVLSPSMRCNLRCYGCYAGNYTRKDDLDVDIVHRVIDEAKEMGIYFFVISGGEPFYWRHFLDVLAQHNDAYFQIYTNGHLITEEMASHLAELGNALPCISVEGFEEETDARRGEGAFAKVLEAMENLREAGVPFGFSVTATRDNNELVVSDEFVDFFADKGCFAGWYFNYVPIGRAPDLELMPMPEQRDWRRRRVNEMRMTRPIILADFWNDGPLVGGCLAGGRNYLHINNKGDVEPCVFVHFAVDNIKDKSLVEVLRSPFFEAWRKRRPYDDK